MTLIRCSLDESFSAPSGQLTFTSICYTSLLHFEFEQIVQGNGVITLPTVFKFRRRLTWRPSYRSMGIGRGANLTQFIVLEILKIHSYYY